MKPTLWYSDGAWICSCINYTMIPPENTEEYIQWACAAEGITPQEAYANWEKECDVYRKEYPIRTQELRRIKGWNSFPLP